MEQYFEEVVRDLTINDLQLMGYLFDEEATAGYKAIRQANALVITGLSEAVFRKTISRLVANKFITTVSQQKSHSLYITSFGIAALQKLNVIEREVTA